MNKKWLRGQKFALVFLFTATSAIASELPIGELVTSGDATVTGNGVTVELRDQRYAYFPGDVVRTGEQSRAAIVMNDGVKIRFAELSAGRVLFLDEVYNIDRIAGQLTLEAESGIPYRVSENGELVGDTRFFASGEPIIIASGYVPAQLSEAQIEALEANGNFTADEIAALKEATKNMSQEELANMTEEDLRALLPPAGSSGGLSTGAKIGIAAAIIVGAALIIDDDDNDDGGGDSGTDGGTGGGEVVPPPPPPPPAPKPPSGGSSTPDAPEDKEPGS